MKKYFVLLLSMATVIGISPDQPNGNLVYASNGLMNMSDRTIVLKGSTEETKVQFAYEMAQITTRVMAVSNGSAENFKVEFAYATAQLTAKIMPLLPDEQRNGFAYEMSQITTKIISTPNLEVEKSKAKFAYEMAELTAKIINRGDQNFLVSNTMPQSYTAYNTPQTTLLRNNAEIEQKIKNKVNDTKLAPEKKVNAGYVAPETYNALIDDLMHVSDGKNKVDNKMKINGEIRFHYALNSGDGRWSKDSSGVRLYLGTDAAINKDWRAYAMLEGQRSVVNYNDEFKFSRLYAEGKVGTSRLKVGSFSYPMAEGNVYDSGYKGVKWDFGDTIKYTFSVGKADDTKNTTVATARYTDFDYNVEAGLYHYQLNDGTDNQNTITTLGGNYNFSNFSVGAMALQSSLKDSKGNNKGYVLALNYGDLKTYRPGSYDAFIKYYNQPKGTYIAHGMNAAGTSMQGFKGYGLGTHYTFSKDFVGGLEYYNLTDKITGEKSQTWWSDFTYYF